MEACIRISLDASMPRQVGQEWIEQSVSTLIRVAVGRDESAQRSDLSADEG